VGAVNGQCCKPTNPPSNLTVNPASCGLNSKLFPQACLQTPMKRPGEGPRVHVLRPDRVRDARHGDGGAAAHSNSARKRSPLDFVANCPTDAGQPMGTRPKWREFDFTASFPSPVNGSSISFAAQTGPIAGDAGAFLPATPLALGTTPTNLALTDRVPLDTSPGGSGKFTTATPPLVSQDALRIWVTMTPTADQLSSPTLVSWQGRVRLSPAE